MINDLLEYSKVTRKEQVFKPVKLEKVLEEALINLIVPTEEHNAIIGYIRYQLSMGMKGYWCNCSKI